MIRTELAVAWLVAEPAADATAIEAWCRDAAVSRDPGDVMVQLGDGRGRLSGGRGALVLGAPGETDAIGSPGWCADLVRAEFRLRQVHAPGEQPDLASTRAMLLTRTYTPDGMRDEFRDWLQREHSQRQLDVPGNHWYLGYEEVGPNHSFMNFWGIDDPSVADGDAWDRARLTPWRERMVPAMAGMDRGFYRPIGSAGSG